MTDDEVMEAEILRLLELDRVAYDRQRKQSAKRLGIKVKTLDDLVAAARGKIGAGSLPGQKIEWGDEESWPDSVDLADEIADLLVFLKKMMVMTEAARVAVVLWVVFTHCLECFDHSPRLIIKSAVLRCGKTRLLAILKQLVFHPLEAANISAASVFRVIDWAHPTLLLDEADTYLPENEALRGVINSGFDREGAKVIRCIEGQADLEPRSFSTWCPVAIARIGNSAPTIEDRAIAALLERKRPAEKLPRLLKADKTRLQQYRRRLAGWARDNAVQLQAADPEIPEALNDRAADAWRPLLAIADLAGETVGKLAREAAVELVGANEEQTQTYVLMALADIRDWLKTHTLDPVSSAEIADHLATLEERPWPEYGRSRKPISKAQVSRLFAPIKLISGTVRRDEETFKGYTRKALNAVIARYFSSSPRDPPAETSQRHNGSQGAENAEE
jgi:putative DNA primase/helicase